MKTVRVDNGAVAEIIPQYATPVEQWYGAAFAALCTEAPDEVGQNWLLRDGAFIPPDNAQAPAEPVPAEPEEPTTEADILDTVLDHEARLAALELGGES